MRSKKLDKANWSGLCAQISQELTCKRAELEIVSLPQTGQRHRWMPVSGLNYDATNDVLEVTLAGSQHMLFRPSEMYAGYGPNGLETVGIVANDRTWQIELSGVGRDASTVRQTQRKTRQTPQHKAVAEVVAAIRRELPYSCDGITVISAGGQVVLRGELEWDYQRERAASAADSVPNVGQVNNQIEVRPWTEPAQIARRIRAAFSS